MTRFAALWGLMFLLAHVAVPADTGGLLFRTHCSPCHGVHGEGGKGPPAGGPVQSNPVAYVHDGRQYLVLAAGHSLIAFSVDLAAK